MSKKRTSINKILFISKIILVLFTVAFWFAVFIDFNVVIDNHKTTLWIHAPSVVEAEESFDVNVEAWDQYERLAGTYQEEISFSLESYSYDSLNAISSTYSLPSASRFMTNFIWGGLFPAYKFEGADNGKKSFSMQINTAGIHYIVVSEGNGNHYRSNPIVVKPKSSNFERLYWGDIHAHTTYSDGSGFPDESYAFARDVALCDFAALTDHAELFPRFGDVDLFNKWQNYIDITNSFNEDGEFATIVAAEYTPMLAALRSYLSPPHINVYFKGDSMPYFSHYDFVNQDELISHIESNSESDFVCWTHHTLRNSQPSDFAYYDPTHNTMIEIYSCHGSCEVIGEENYYYQIGEVTEKGYSIRDMFKMGRKSGIMASSDTHDGRMGHSNLHTTARTLTTQPYTLAAYQNGVPYPGGLTGLYLPELSREQVFEGLKTRSGYATTWVNRHYMEFSINGVSVGEEDSTIKVSSKTTPRTIEILACVDGVSRRTSNLKTITKIEIIKNSELWQTIDAIDGPLKRISITDSAEITGTAYDGCIKKEDGNWYVNSMSTNPVNPEDLNTAGVDYYYVRMQDSDNGAAWIGPIWVEVAV